MFGQEERKQYDILCERDKYVEEHKKEYLEQHPELDEQENAVEIEEVLTSQFCEKNDIEPQQLDDIDDALDKRCEIRSLKRQIKNIENSHEIKQEVHKQQIKEYKEIIKELEQQIEQTISNLSEKDRQEFEMKDSEKNEREHFEKSKLNEKENNFLDEFEEEENDLQMDNLLMGNSEDELEINEENKERPSINPNVNPIIANVPEEDFKQSYTEEIKENPILKFFRNIQNRLTQKKLTEGQVQKIQVDSNELKQEDYTQEVKTSFFERARNALSKLIHRNKKTTLTLDTAKNNAKTTYEESKESFDNSLIVTEEEQKKYKAEYEATRKENHHSKGNLIETNSHETIGI